MRRLSEEAGKRNMKHRLEFWKYTIFEYEEATEHLNEMAARGWALREITLAWMPVACYEKDDGADGYTYTAEVMTELEDEDLLVLCQDAGWERILQLRNGMWVFRTKEKAARRLFFDTEARREAAWENYRNNSQGALTVVCLLLIGGILFGIWWACRGLEISWYMKSLFWGVPRRDGIDGSGGDRQSPLDEKRKLQQSRLF